MSDTHPYIILMELVLYNKQMDQSGYLMVLLGQRNDVNVTSVPESSTVLYAQ